jgi:hypothetical protein
MRNSPNVAGSVSALVIPRLIHEDAGVLRFPSALFSSSIASVSSQSADRMPPAAVGQSAPWPELSALPAASVYLSAVIILTFVDVFTHWHPAAFIAAPFMIAYFAKVWRRLMINGRVLLIACAVVGVIAAMRPGGFEILGLGASRMIYLPSFVALLGLLRAAAGASKLIAAAGRHLVNQPPSRRYLALSFGGHFFGILLNIGGLALLVEMVKGANTLEAAGGDPLIVAWRERRMTVAVLRGFAGIAFWSPLGVSFNLLLISVPGLTWGQAGPIGIACAAGFIMLGWVFDQFQRPKGLRPRPVVKEPGGARAVAAVIAHVAAVSVLTWATEFMLKVSFQTALLIAVPAYALGWTYGLRIAQADPAPVKSSAAIMLHRGVASFPAYANEVAVFAASGFLGAALVAMVPREALQSFFLAFSMPPGLFAGLLSVSVAVLGLIGLNPMIAATILASAVHSAGVPGLSSTALVLAIAAGWTCTVVAGPMNSSLVMTAALIERTPWRVAVKWNGPFALGVLAAAIIILAVLV